MVSLWHGARLRVPWRALLLGCALLASACSTVPAPSRALVPDTQLPVTWRPAFVGIRLAAYRQTSPVPLAWYAARVDLRAPGVRFFVTPPETPGATTTAGKKASTFLKDYGLQLAINASTFDPVRDTEGLPTRITGLSVSDGVLYSPPSEVFGALLIDEANHVTLAAPPVDPSGAYSAVGAYGALLERGENVGEDAARHPRTAVGLSHDGHYLYFLVIDGRQPGYSVGATLAETATWLQCVGAYEALNLDGGGSSELVIQDRNGGATILNRPIHGGVPGAERVLGNHLGVAARKETNL